MERVSVSTLVTYVLTAVFITCSAAPGPTVGRQEHQSPPSTRPRHHREQQEHSTPHHQKPPQTTAQHEHGPSQSDPSRQEPKQESPLQLSRAWAALYTDQELKDYFDISDDNAPGLSNLVLRTNQNHKPGQTRRHRHGHGEGHRRLRGDRQDHRQGGPSLRKTWTGAPGTAGRSAHVGPAQVTGDRTTTASTGQGEAPAVSDLQPQEGRQPPLEDAGRGPQPTKAGNESDSDTSSGQEGSEAGNKIFISIDAVTKPRRNQPAWVVGGLAQAVNDQRGRVTYYRSSPWTAQSQYSYSGPRSSAATLTTETLALLTQKLSKMEGEMARLKEAVLLQGAVHIKTSERLESMLLAQAKLAIKNDIATRKVLKRLRRCCPCSAAGNGSSTGRRARTALRASRRGRHSGRRHHRAQQGSRAGEGTETGGAGDSRDRDRDGSIQTSDRSGSAGQGEGRGRTSQRSPREDGGPSHPTDDERRSSAAATDGQGRGRDGDSSVPDSTARHVNHSPVSQSRADEDNGNVRVNSSLSSSGRNSDSVSTHGDIRRLEPAEHISLNKLQQHSQAGGAGSHRDKGKQLGLPTAEINNEQHNIQTTSEGQTSQDGVLLGSNNVQIKNDLPREDGSHTTVPVKTVSGELSEAVEATDNISPNNSVDRTLFSESADRRQENQKTTTASELEQIITVHTPSNDEQIPSVQTPPDDERVITVQMRLDEEHTTPQGPPGDKQIVALLTPSDDDQIREIKEQSDDDQIRTGHPPSEEEANGVFGTTPEERQTEMNQTALEEGPREITQTDLDGNRIVAIHNLSKPGQAEINETTFEPEQTDEVQRLPEQRTVKPAQKPLDEVQAEIMSTPSKMAQTVIVKTLVQGQSETPQTSAEEEKINVVQTSFPGEKQIVTVQTPPEAANVLTEGKVKSNKQEDSAVHREGDLEHNHDPVPAIAQHVPMQPDTAAITSGGPGPDSADGKERVYGHAQNVNNINVDSVSLRNSTKDSNDVVGESRASSPPPYSSGNVTAVEGSHVSRVVDGENTGGSLKNRIDPATINLDPDNSSYTDTQLGLGDVTKDYDEDHNEVIISDDNENNQREAMNAFADTGDDRTVSGVATGGVHMEVQHPSVQRTTPEQRVTTPEQRVNVPLTTKTHITDTKLDKSLSDIQQKRPDTLLTTQMSSDAQLTTTKEASDVQLIGKVSPHILLSTTAPSDVLLTKTKEPSGGLLTTTEPPVAPSKTTTEPSDGLLTRKEPSDIPLTTTHSPDVLLSTTKESPVVLLKNTKEPPDSPLTMEKQVSDASLTGENDSAETLVDEATENLRTDKLLATSQGRLDTGVTTKKQTSEQLLTGQKVPSDAFLAEKESRKVFSKTTTKEPSHILLTTAATSKEISDSFLTTKESSDLLLTTKTETSDAMLSGRKDTLNEVLTEERERQAEGNLPPGILLTTKKSSDLSLTAGEEDSNMLLTDEGDRSEALSPAEKESVLTDVNADIALTTKQPSDSLFLRENLTSNTLVTTETAPPNATSGKESSDTVLTSSEESDEVQFTAGDSSASLGSSEGSSVSTIFPSTDVISPDVDSQMYPAATTSVTASSNDEASSPLHVMVSSATAVESSSSPEAFTTSSNGEASSPPDVAVSSAIVVESSPLPEAVTMLDVVTPSLPASAEASLPDELKPSPPGAMTLSPPGAASLSTKDSQAGMPGGVTSLYSEVMAPSSVALVSSLPQEVVADVIGVQTTEMKTTPATATAELSDSTTVSAPPPRTTVSTPVTTTTTTMSTTPTTTTTTTTMTTTVTEEIIRTLSVDLTTGEVENADLPGVTWVVPPSEPPARSRFVSSRWRRSASAPCSMQGVLKFSFTPPNASRAHSRRRHQQGGGAGDGDSGSAGAGGRRRLQLEMDFHRPRRWVFNLGDSIANNGFSGDGTVQENDSEAQGYGTAFAVYASDKHPNGRQKLLKMYNNFIYESLTLEVSDQAIAWDNHRGKAGRVVDSSLFALAGQPDNQGSVNYDVYLGLNRVIDGNYRYGYGLCRVVARWLDDNDRKS